MIEFLMSKNVTYLEVVLYLLGSSSFKMYTLLCVAGSTIKLMHKKKGSTQRYPFLLSS